MKRIAMLIATLALLLPASALAASGGSTCQSYNPQLCSVADTNAAQSTLASSPTTGSTSSGTLPFTGLDVVLLAAGGAALLGAGLVVRRLSGSVN